MYKFTTRGVLGEGRAILSGETAISAGTTAVYGFRGLLGGMQRVMAADVN